MELKQLTVSRLHGKITCLSNFLERCCPNLEKFCWDDGHLRVTDHDAKRLADEANVFFGLVPKLRKLVYWHYKPRGNERSRITLCRDYNEI